MKDLNKNINYNVNIKAKTDKSLSVVQKTLNGVKKNIDNLKKSIKLPKIQAPNLNGVKKQFANLKESTKDFANEIPGLGKAFEVLSNPIAAAAAATVAWGTAMVGTAKEVKVVDDQLRKFIDNKDELNSVSDSIRALNKTFEDVDTKSLSEAANVMSKEFGITATEAMKKLEQGMIATNGALNLDDIKEFSNQIASVNGTADDLLTNMITAQNEGMFSNKSLDAMKDFGKNMRSGSDSVKELLKTVGKGSVIDKVQKGIISQQDAYKEIYKDFDKYTLKQQQELTTLLGGGGEALGARGIQLLATQSASLDELASKFSDVKEINDENKKLTEAQGRATRMLINPIKAVEKIWIRLQTLFYDISEPIVGIVVEFGKLIKDLFKGSGQLGLWKTILDVVVFNLKLMLNAVKGVIMFLRGIFKILGEIRQYLIDKFKGLIESIFGKELIEEWTNSIFSAIDFVGAKFNQLVTMIQKGFEAAGAYIDGDLEKAGKLKDEAVKAGKALFSMSRERSGTTGFGAEGKGSTKEGDNTKSTVDKAIGNAMDNSVKSSVTGEVKNITIKMDAVQKVENQVINGFESMDSFKSNLQTALISIIEDTSTI